MTIQPFTAAPSNEEIGTPLWWVRRLQERLSNRLPAMAKYRRLVDDEHDLPTTPAATAKFTAMAGLVTTNLCGLAVEATAERMQVEGFRFGDDPNADADAWRIWQASDFDAGSEQCITDALIYGRGFISVDPAQGQPRLYAEDPRQVYVAYSGDGRRERIAALKLFVDEWTGNRLATLYMPDAIYRFEQAGSESWVGAGNPMWAYRAVTGQPAITPNPLGQIPFFELVNKPRGQVRSEIANLEVPQRRLNEHAFRTDVVAEFGAFRQKWGAGIEIPTDPATGERIPVPFAASVANMFVAEKEGSRFGDFNSTDLAPYINQGREIAAHIARISRVPVTYFLTDVANLSAEALALLVSGLVKKCQRRVTGYEPAFEGAMRLAFASVGDPRAQAVTASTKWANMETQSLAQAADAAVKLVQAGVITGQTAQEQYLGMDQTQRDRDEAWRSENDALGRFTNLLNDQASPLTADAVTTD